MVTRQHRLRQMQWTDGAGYATASRQMGLAMLLPVDRWGWPCYCQ